MGIPSGIILASDFSAPSCCSSAEDFCGDCLPCSMSRPICIRIIPPAILKAGSVMPNILKIKLPAIANAASTIAQVSADFRAIAFRSGFSVPAVTARNSGITANGSTRKNIDVSASSANSRTVLIVAGICLQSNPVAPRRFETISCS